MPIWTYIHTDIPDFLSILCPADGILSKLFSWANWELLYDMEFVRCDNQEHLLACLECLVIGRIGIH